MWSTIGSVSATQLRLAGARYIGRVVAQLSRQPSTATPIAFRTSLSRGRNVIFPRGFATAKAPKKATTTKKKPAAKKLAIKSAKKPAKKPAAKKKAPVKKKPTGRPKKPLTDEQKAKLRIRELKAKSLVSEEPKRLAVTPFSLYFSDYAKEKKGQGIPIQDILREAGTNFKAFTPSQLERYVEVGDKNKAINTTTIRTFVLSKSVEEIAVANRARKELRALGFKAPVLPDERRPKGPLNTFALYVAEYWKKENPTGVTAAEVVKRAASEWKSLSDSDRQLFEQRAAVDKERYVQEREAIGWTVKSSTKSP